MPNLRINVSNRQKALPLSTKRVKKLVAELLKKERICCEEVSIFFVSEKKIAELHEQFFSDPTPTDCISFPLDENYLGDIFVCTKVAVEYAEKKGLDPILETTLYIVHGLLHLLGYNDIDPNDRRKMRKKEKTCMRFLKEQNLSIE